LINRNKQFENQILFLQSRLVSSKPRTPGLSQYCEIYIVNYRNSWVVFRGPLTSANLQNNLHCNLKKKLFLNFEVPAKFVRGFIISTYGFLHSFIILIYFLPFLLLSVLWPITFLLPSIFLPYPLIKISSLTLVRPYQLSISFLHLLLSLFIRILATNILLSLLHY
jgi:hypothetical protein